MPRSCSICSHEKTAEITKALAAGDSVRVAAARFGVTPASVGRHLRGCLQTERRAEKSRRDAAPANETDASRFATGGTRCATCGIDRASPEPAALVRRAERILWIAETIAGQAQEGDDARLALQAVDRARTSLDQLLKVYGLLQPDGGTTINVNTEEMTLKKAFPIVVRAITGEQRQAQFLELFRAFSEGREYELPVTIDAPSALVAAKPAQNQDDVSGLKTPDSIESAEVSP